MLSTISGELLFRIGILLMAAAAVGIIVTTFVFLLKKKRLRVQLEQEYGKNNLER